MVGVSQDNLCTASAQFFSRDGLDGSSGPHGHEHRSFNVAVGGMENPGPGAGLGGLGSDFKVKHGFLQIQLSGYLYFLKPQNIEQGISNVEVKSFEILRFDIQAVCIFIYSINIASP
jgi:hypothetical protein